MFYQKLENAIQQKQSFLCVGLDPVLEKLPPHLPQNVDGVHQFLEAIVQATQSHAVAYKPNFAYFEALGPAGMEMLQTLVQKLPQDTLIIADAKRGDVGHTAAQYAKAAFETFACDVITVNPYQGWDAVQPFLEYTDKGTFLLCLTSNPSAADFEIPNELYLRVAQKAAEWNTHQNLGLVVGATHPEHIQKVRDASGAMPYLIPGVGAQGGDFPSTLRLAHDGSKRPYVINASRAILYASSEEDFAQKAGEVAQSYQTQMQPFV